MELEQLRETIRALVCLRETADPVISCFLTFDEKVLTHERAHEESVESLRRSFTGEAARLFEEALRPIERFLTARVSLDTRGVAVFSRAGSEPIFVPLQFHVPLPTWIAADTLPNVYHLIELKDTYHRYVVLNISENYARIIAVNLGSATLDLMERRPDLRERLCREWSREHFESHRADRTRRFLRTIVETLEKIVSQRGYGHLILAGRPAMTARIKRLLPPLLAAKLVGAVPASGQASSSDLVTSTLVQFVKAEQSESRQAVLDLERRLHRGGLAVAGPGPSFRALERGQAETLLLAANYDQAPVWSCRSCGSERIARERPQKCKRCGAPVFSELNPKEVMIRLAERSGCEIELVQQNGALHRLGGVGCLLRYRL